MCHNIIICSENTGVSPIIKERKIGFIFYNNNSKNELAEKILFVLKNKTSLQDIKKNAREAYEEYFSDEVFTKNINNIITTLLEVRFFCFKYLREANDWKRRK